MTEEENILKMIIEKESWEEIIYYIVSVENLDPWNIDLIKLTDRFVAFIHSSKQLDFRIPAKIIFVVAILLRIKANNLSIFEERVEEGEEVAKPREELLEAEIAELGIPMRRIPKRQIVLDELINALKKALAVRERKTERRIAWRARLEAQIGEEDIEKRIEQLMNEIEKLTKEMNADKIKFSQIVPKWTRDEIVNNLIPLLHLDQNKKVKTEQEEFFKDIWVSKTENKNI